LMFQMILYWKGDQNSAFYLKQKAKKIERELEWKAWISTIDVWGTSWW
jgi:hypothetical protein